MSSLALRRPLRGPGQSAAFLRRLLSTSRGPSGAVNRLMLIYSNRLDVIDPTVKRSQARYGQEEKVRLRDQNDRLRAALDGAGAGGNLSVALPFVYGGAAFFRQGDNNVVAADEVVQDDGHHLDAEPPERKDRAGPAVYPFGIYPKSFADALTPKLSSGDVAEADESDENKAEDKCKGRGRRGRRSRQRRPAAGEDVSEEDFEVLDGSMTPAEAKKTLSQDEMFRYGSFEPDEPSSQVPCGGCGALLHCRDPKLPGFTPREIFQGKREAQLRNVICQRCYIMREYKVALKVSVSPSDYPRTIQHLHAKRAIVLLVVDLLDFPGSVWPNIIDLLGTNKKIILVGNKVDMLPQDSVGYLKRVEKSMREVFLEKCNQGLITHEPRLVDSILVSARTGFHVENLINKIYDNWKERNYFAGADVYLIGTTNVGKSSLFNRLLESDLCKVQAVDQVERAMTSPVPGTTLNLLKFPIMRPDPWRLNERINRLQKTFRVFRREEQERIDLLRRHRDRKYAVRRGPVELTFLYKMDKALPLTGGAFSLQRRNPKVALPQRLDPLDPAFADGKWCYDTPGTVCHDQLINLLTQDEVAKMLPDLPLQPRSFTFKVGQSLFLGGLARLDLVSGPYVKRPMIITVFCSDGLPINMVRTEDAEEFYREGLAAGFLEVPAGSPLRLADFPPLEGRELEVDGVDLGEASCDVVLSSAGWVTCSPDPGRVSTVRAWTPGGRGIYLRDPPFLPFAARLRGHRIGGTPAYDCEKIFVPPY